MKKTMWALVGAMIVLSIIFASCAAGTPNGELEAEGVVAGASENETVSETVTEPTTESTTELTTESTTVTTTKPTTEATTRETTTAKPTTTQKQTTTKKETTTQKQTTTKQETTTKKETTTQKQTTTQATTASSSEWNVAYVEERIVYYINQYRIGEGKTACKILPRMTEYAERRSKQLMTNYAHDTAGSRAIATEMKFGEYCSSEYLAAVGFDDTTPFYDPHCGEAIFKGSSAGKTVDGLAKEIANCIYESPGHWKVIGSADAKYMACGLTLGADSRGCIVVSAVDPDTFDDATFN